ncbi:hypothetical protein HNY73_010664 [Argiope bruennichi]|uniref:Uncharacterized protein n=1 Tax=Argiope bruennichi TaxID=94029 RepID=A0A8T0F6M1_ARGBR|nr:hypothetical protein HNY73_010664 [Argiope bruennichi]
MGPVVAAKYYKEVLQMKSDFQLSDLTSSRINLFRRTIEYWSGRQFGGRDVFQCVVSLRCFLLEANGRRLPHCCSIKR